MTATPRTTASSADQMTSLPPPEELVGRIVDSFAGAIDLYAIYVGLARGHKGRQRRPHGCAPLILSQGAQVHRRLQRHTGHIQFADGDKAILGM